MSVSKGLEDYLNRAKQDKVTENFQQQYLDMLKKGVIQPKGYNLAGVNVIGGKVPSMRVCSFANTDC